ncbi:MAG: amino acid ABC transporter substrate-binding protein [Desulfurococcales archaeon]|nr:amino acid ABC transporter substrate-binding protein [Desulfurococcales archaeon]
MRKGLNIVLVLTLASLVALAPAYTLVSMAATYPTTVSGNVIKIGMPISLSGKFATEGHQALCGVIATIMWINDHGGVNVNGKTYKLQLIYYDDASSANNEPSIVQKLITQDHVNFLLAPYSSGLTSAAAPIAEQYHVIMLSHGGASNAIFQKGYHYLVQILSPASEYFTGALEIIKQYIPDAKIAFIYANDKFASSVVQYAEQKAKQMGLDVVYSKAYEVGTSDFSTFISAAKAAGANVLLGGGHFADGKALVKQAHDLGWHLKFIAILVAPAEPAFYQQLDDIANGVAYPSQWEPGVKYSPQLAKQMGLEWFGPTVQEWISYFNKAQSEVSICKGIGTPSYHAAEAGAAVLFLVKAIESAGTLDNAKVRQAMNNIDIMTFFGRLKIDPKTGLQIGHKMVVAQWQNGKRVVVWPPEVAQAKPLIAPPNWWPSTATTSTASMSSTSASATTSSTTSTSSVTSSTTTKKTSKAVLWGSIIVIIIVIIVGVWLAVRK